MSEESSSIFIFGDRQIFPYGYFPNKPTGGATEANKKLGGFLMSNGAYVEQTFVKPSFRVIKDVEDFDSEHIPEPTFQEALIFLGELYFGAVWNDKEKIFKETEFSGRWKSSGKHPDMIKRMKLFPHLDVSANQKIKMEQKKGHTLFIYKKGKLDSVVGFGRDVWGRYKIVLDAYNQDNLHVVKFDPSKKDPENQSLDMTKTLPKIFPPAPPKETGTRERGGDKMSEETEIEQIGRDQFETQTMPAEFIPKSDDKALKLVYQDENGFMVYPYMDEWKSNIGGKGVEDPQKHVASAYRIFLLNNHLENPYFLTAGMKDAPLNVKLDAMKKMVAIAKHWAGSFKTDEKFYKTKWRDPLYSATEDLEFPVGTWENLESFKQREKKSGLERKYNTGDREENFRKATASILTQFVEKAPVGAWLVGKQPSGTLLSKKISETTYKTHGQNVDDKQIQQAIKFLETGIEHQWRPDLREGKKIYIKLNETHPDGTSTEIRELVEALYPKKGDKMDFHYNTTLKEYQRWGKPYAPDSPASLFFRIGILCGWRKVEGLTCPTRERTVEGQVKYSAGIVRKGENPSGIHWDEQNAWLNVAFLTRKTSRSSKLKYDNAVIPPFSSDVMDTRDTISLILRKAGRGDWENKNYYNYDLDEDEEIEKDGEKIKNPYFNTWIKSDNLDWLPIVREFSDEELNDMFPQRTVKTRKNEATPKGEITLPRGKPSELIIGWQGQFYHVKSFQKNMNKWIPSWELPTGTELTKPEDADMVSAYLTFPLRECYLMMKGSTMKKRSDSDIISQLDEDALEDEKLKIFELKNNGWATECKSGCQGFLKKERGELSEFKYSAERMEQDVLRYKTSDQDYWIYHANHSVRHIFAQLWLQKSDWNFGVVASRGHWETLDTLKKHYGGMHQEKYADFMIQVLAKDQVGSHQMIKQKVAEQLQKRNSTMGMAKEATSFEEALIEEESNPPPVEETKSDAE